jgi:sugar/nucleoside kinase (ribokinase family)
MTAGIIVLGGRIYCDLIFSGLPSLPCLGTEIFAQELAINIGGSANTAIALRRLGLQPYLMADLGTDFFSEYIRAMLKREDLDGSLIQNRDFQTAAVTVALPWNDERALVSYIDPQELPGYDASLLNGSTARFLHVCGMGTAHHHAELIQAARDAGMILLIDCACENIDLANPLTRSILGTMNYTMANTSEAMAMTQARNIYKATKRLGELSPTVVVKMGADGALAYSRGQWVDAPALTLEPVDTTGAGDCFAAGFIFGLVSGCSLEECLRYGNVAGGLSTLGCGISCAPTLEQFQQHIASGPRATTLDHMPSLCSQNAVSGCAGDIAPASGSR